MREAAEGLLLSTDEGVRSAAVPADSPPDAGTEVGGQDQAYGVHDQAYGVHTSQNSGVKANEGFIDDEENLSLNSSEYLDTPLDLVDFDAPIGNSSSGDAVCPDTQYCDTADSYDLNHAFITSALESIPENRMLSTTSDTSYGKSYDSSRSSYEVNHKSFHEVTDSFHLLPVGSNSVSLSPPSPPSSWVLGVPAAAASEELPEQNYATDLRWGTPATDESEVVNSALHRSIGELG